MVSVIIILIDLFSRGNNFHQCPISHVSNYRPVSKKAILQVFLFCFSFCIVAHSTVAYMVSHKAFFNFLTFSPITCWALLHYRPPCPMSYQSSGMFSTKYQFFCFVFSTAFENYFSIIFISFIWEISFHNGYSVWDLWIIQSRSLCVAALCLTSSFLMIE